MLQRQEKFYLCHYWISGVRCLAEIAVGASTTLPEEWLPAGWIQYLKFIVLQKGSVSLWELSYKLISLKSSNSFVILAVPNWPWFEQAVLQRSPTNDYFINTLKILWFLSMCICMKYIEILQVKSSWFLCWKNLQKVITPTIPYVRECGGVHWWETSLIAIPVKKILEYKIIRDEGKENVWRGGGYE